MAYYRGSAADLQSRRAVISQDLGQWDTQLPSLAGQDAVNPGVQRTELSAAHLATRRARDYTFTESLFAPLIGQDAVNPGRQQLDLPPRAAGRARDYSWESSLPPILIGQDALNAGVQSLELPPRGAARARDYSFTESIFAPLIGADAMVSGKQLSDRAPIGRPRAVTLSEPGVNLTLALNAAGQVVLPAGQSTLGTDLAPRGTTRSRDYTQAVGFPPELIGQDALPTGHQATDLAPKGAQRTYALYDPGINWLTTILSSTTPSLPPGAAITDVALLGPRRARDYTQAFGFPLELIGQDSTVPGDQAVDLPPTTRQRSRDYTWLQTLPLHLLSTTLPPGATMGSTEVPPRGPARNRDYTWLQTLPLFVYQQLPPGDTRFTERPPLGPVRARDYSWAWRRPLELDGQDVMYGAPGQVPIYDWPVPKGYRRPLSNLAPAPNNMVALFVTAPVPQRDLVYAVGTPRSGWRVGTPGSRWQINTARE